MEQAHLLELGSQLIQVISPLIAGGALAKLGEQTTDATHTLLRRAWALLTQQFTGDEKAKATLTLYEDDAEDAKMQQRLVQQIVARFAQHEAAITALAEVVQALQAEQGTTSSAGGRSHTLTMKDNARAGFANAGDFHGSLTVGRMDFGDQGVRPAPAPAAPVPARAAAAATSALPTTLSADGVHFSYGHALLIGVGRYATISSPLTTATDAEQLAALLRDPQLAAYPNEQVNVLSGAAATRAGIIDALDALAAQVKERKHATVLLFFAGHGTTKDGSYYLLPHDTRLGDLPGTALDAATFRQKVEAIAQHAQKLIIILNCCHSGGVTDGVLDAADGATPDTPPPPAAFYTPLIAGSGRVLISAARPAERAGAVAPHDRQLTTFGARLLEALRGDAPGQGPAVGVFDLFTYLAAHIPPDARTITDPSTGQPLEQHPLLSARQVDQDFALALRPAARRDDATLDAALDAAIQRLAAIEIALAAYRSEADAPPALVAERDGLLAPFGA